MPGLTFMHGVFGLDRVPHSLTHGCATQMRNLTRTSPLSKYIASMKTRRNVCTQAELWRLNKPRSRPLVFTTTGRHGTRMSSLSQATSGTLVSQEKRGLLDYDVLDKNQNLICHSENIPPMLKGSRSMRVNLNIKEMDCDIERGLLGR